jgi:hypothetical protein
MAKGLKLQQELVRRNATMEGCGALRDCWYLLHDCAAKYSTSFRAIIETGRVKTLFLPARSSKSECLLGNAG